MPEELKTESEQEPEDHLGMTDEQWARFQEYTHGYGDQDENGVDLSLLRYNLKLTPTERIIKNQQALAFLEKVDRAAIRAGLRQSTTGTE